MGTNNQKSGGPIISGMPKKTSLSKFKKKNKKKK